MVLGRYLLLEYLDTWGRVIGRIAILLITYNLAWEIYDPACSYL